MPNQITQLKCPIALFKAIEVASALVRLSKDTDIDYLCNAIPE